MRKQIDFKHAAVLVGAANGEEIEIPQLDTLEIRICKTTADGRLVPIPENEPMILFRGRDHLAVALLEHYHTLCALDGCNEFQLTQVQELIDRFKRFAAENPGVMKQPGVTKGF